MANDSVITNPDQYFAGERNQDDPKAFNTRYPVKAWNRVRGKQYFLSHHYNLGFERELEGEVDTLGNPVKVFIPVSSIIHTLEYQDNRRRFRSEADENLNECYLTPDGYPRVFGLENGTGVDDRTSYWNLRNTFGLSSAKVFKTGPSSASLPLPLSTSANSSCRPRYRDCLTTPNMEAG